MNTLMRRIHDRLNEMIEDDKDFHDCVMLLTIPWFIP